MFNELNKCELMEIEGGITLLAAVALGGACLIIGTGLGLGVTYVASKL